MLVYLIGASGTGKDSVAKYLNLDYHYEIIKPYTTRPKRTNSEDGYYFITDKTFKLFYALGDFSFIQSYDTTFGEWNYGYKIPPLTMYKQYNFVFIIPPRMYANLLEKHITGVGRNDNYNLTFWLQAPIPELRKRLSKRGDNRKELERRISADKQDFNIHWKSQVDENINTKGTTPKEIAKHINHIVSAFPNGIEH